MLWCRASLAQVGLGWCWGGSGLALVRHPREGWDPALPLGRHSREGGNLPLIDKAKIKSWIPAFARMTIKIKMDPSFRWDDEPQSPGIEEVLLALTLS